MRTSALTPAHELRDQIYYQLLYPHWFAIVDQWRQGQTKTVCVTTIKKTRTLEGSLFTFYANSSYG